MKNEKCKFASRRQVLKAMAAAAAGSLFRPALTFGAVPVKNSLRFAVLGDWGTGDSDGAGIAEKMALSHRASPFDFVLAAGDNIYPNGSGRHFVKKFERPFAALLRDRVPFHAALGNHDVVEGRQDQCQYPLFNMGGQNYYTVRKGDGLAEFFMLDSTDFDAAQAAWVEQALSSSAAKWKVAVLHHPLYSSGKRHGSSLELRKRLEPVFVRYRVDAVFSGHDHIYERTLPQQGVQHFVTGAGGKVRDGGIDLKSGFRAVSYDEDNHFMRVEIDDRRLSFEAVSEGGLVVDSGVITRP
jgi:hypothetical protein